MSYITNMNKETRVFFVVDSPWDNQKIFETLEEAEVTYKKIQQERIPDHQPRLYIAIVKNAYREGDFYEVATWWNYSDHEDTFELIKLIE